MTTAIIAKTRKYIRIFRSHQAIDPAHAIIPGENGISRSLVFKKLVRQGIIKNTGNEKYYLDEIKEAEVRKARRKILTIIFSAFLLTGLIIYLISLFTNH